MTWHAVGLDLSLTNTGVAVLRGDRERILLRNVLSSPNATGPRDPKTNRQTATLLDRRDRLQHAAARIIDAALTGYAEGDDPPLFVIEAPLYAAPMKTDPVTGERKAIMGAGHQHDRSGLWWLVTHILFKRGIVVEVSSTALKQYSTGKGSGRKAGVLAAMQFMFPGVLIDDDNLADAAVLAAMGARHLGHPVEPSSHRVSLAALENVAWPRWPSPPE